MNRIVIDNKKEKMHNLTDRPISCIRLIAFCCIITCHIQQYLGSGLCWWFNVGVQIFLAISGFLYGRKNVSDDIEFYKRKFKQILIPYYLTVLFFILVQFVFFRESINVERVVKVLLCNTTLEGGEHLWFVPTILMCYVLTPFFQKLLEFNVYELRTLFLAILGVFIAFEFFFPYFNSAWISCYLISFAMGYAENHGEVLWEKGMDFCIFMLAVICNTIQIILTYVVRIHLSENGRALFQVFCDYSHALLGIALFSLLRNVLQHILKRREMPCIVNSIVKVSDNYSYEGYLVHQFFILGPMTMMRLTNYTGVNILIVLIVTFLFKKAERCVVDITNRKEIRI